MSKIVAIKGQLHDVHILNILAHALFMPTEEKLLLRANRYEDDPAVHAFGYFIDGLPIGIVIIRQTEGLAFEICNIATEPMRRKKGIGRALIFYVMKQLSCATLCAETDDDAVEFYRKVGFSVTSLGEKYPGCVRYSCVLNRK